MEVEAGQKCQGSLTSGRGPYAVCKDAGGGVAVSTEVVTYQVDASTTVSFEIEPPPGFRQAGAGEIVGKVRDAVGPAVEAAKVVLDKVKEACPDEVEVKFGIKVS